MAYSTWRAKNSSKTEFVLQISASEFYNVSYHYNYLDI